MALTFPNAADAEAKGGQQPSAPTMVMRELVDFDSSYPTGGEDYDPGARLQARSLVDKGADLEVVQVTIEPTETHEFSFDYTNKKIIARVTATGVEVGNGVDLSSLVNVQVTTWAN